MHLSILGRKLLRMGMAIVVCNFGCLGQMGLALRVCFLVWLAEADVNLGEEQQPTALLLHRRSSASPFRRRTAHSPFTCHCPPWFPVPMARNTQADVTLSLNGVASRMHARTENSICEGNSMTPHSIRVYEANNTMRSRHVQQE